ncbi:uncharacterized protein LOC105889549 [Clupea harengus]|uniref:Uncharacterized protein LOC105889549 n=1 Tax=Clupea harengus TaxID=7950 RepID=A0A8M1KSW0_CLUHA|nr:uncharacterized protein LOC105889549 [Clupea harengus]
MSEFSMLLLAGLVLLLLLLVWRRRGGRGLPLPPGPTGLPLLGNLPQVDKRAPFKTFMKWSKQYGPVMTVHLGPKRFVVLSGYQAVKEALVDQADDFTGRAPIPFLNRVVKGYGLAISNGERWRLLRRFTLSTLRDFGMGRKGMEQWIQEESRHLLESLRENKSTPFDPTFFLSRAVSNVICALVFGQRFSYDDANFLRLLQIISDTFRFGSSPWGQLYNIFPRLMTYMPGPHQNVFRHINKLREFVIEKIDQHKETLDPDNPRDYIDCFLIRLNQEKDLPTTEFFYDNLVSTVLNLFFAGTETTSTTMRYAMMLLIKHPEIQEHMHEEIETVIGEQRIPQMEDRKSLPYTDAVIHEAQRYLDIVPLNLPHYATRDITFRGYAIPKDTVIIPMLHSVLRDEDQWENAWTFNSENFLDQNGNFKKNPAFFAFSAGKRACVGESLARMELLLFLVSIVQQFHLSTPGGPSNLDTEPEFSSFGNVPRRYELIATPRPPVTSSCWFKRRSSSCWFERRSSMSESSMLLLAGLVLLLLLLVWRRRGVRGLPLPPGPTGLPLLGNLPQVDKRAPFKTFMKWSNQYGPVMTVHLGPKRFVVLSGYQAVKEALVDQADDFAGRAQIPFAMKLLKGYGLAISNGERWRLLRRFTLSTLRDFGMGRKGMEQWIQEESRHLLESLRETKSTPFDPTYFLSRAVSNVICALVFGQRFSYDDVNFLRLLQIISATIRFGSSPWGPLYNLFPKLMDHLPGPHHTVFSQMEELKAFMREKIHQHKQTLDPDNPRDYIDCFLIRLNQEKDLPTTEFHYDNLIGTVMNLFLAGTETTSTTIRYALMLLIKHTDIQEHVHKEIDTVLGQHGIPQMENRKSLPFTDAVIHEVQRYMDLVPLNVPHYATKDISFKGYAIPKDTVILPMLHSVLRDEDQWENAWTFNPENFLDQNGNFKKNPAFLPFSAGKRACVGESLARMELLLFLVSIVQQFHLSTPGGPSSINTTPELSSFANVPHQYQLIVTPR